MSIGLTFRDALPPAVADEFDATIPRIIKAAQDGTKSTELADFVPWTDVPFSTGNFVQNIGSWTVDQADVILFKYMVAFKTMWLQFSCFQTTLAGSVNTCRLAIPGGYLARNHTAHVGALIWSNSSGVATRTTATSDNPLAAMGDVVVGVGGAYLQLQRNDPTTSVGAGFADAVNAYNFAFSAVIELASGPGIA